MGGFVLKNIISTQISNYNLGDLVDFNPPEQSPR